MFLTLKTVRAIGKMKKTSKMKVFFSGNTDLFKINKHWYFFLQREIDMILSKKKLKTDFASFCFCYLLN